MLLGDLPGVAGVRSVGLAGAVELDAGLLAEHPVAGAAVVITARKHGVLTRLLRGVALQVSPPFVVTEDELAKAGRRRSPHRCSQVVPALSPSGL